MQIQALARGAAGRSLSIMFPMVTEASEFFEARAMVLHEIDRLASRGYVTLSETKIGLMFEVPSLIYASDRLYQEADFISVGGNDLMQFFFAADRENERVRKRYGTLHLSFLALLQQIVSRCEETGTRLSFCGEAAGRPIEALALSAIGYRELSMRSASIGPVKQALRSADLRQVREVIEDARNANEASCRERLQRVVGEHLKTF